MATMKLADLPVTLSFPQEVVSFAGKDPKMVSIVGKQPKHFKGQGWTAFFSKKTGRWLYLPSYLQGKKCDHAIHVDMAPQNGQHRITATYESWMQRGLDAATLAKYGEVAGN